MRSIAAIYDGTFDVFKVYDSDLDLTLDRKRFLLHVQEREANLCPLTIAQINRLQLEAKAFFHEEQEKRAERADVARLLAGLSRCSPARKPLVVPM